MEGKFNYLIKSVFSGIILSLGCLVYLNVGGVAGAVLFAFGLISIVSYGIPLYTGTVGFLRLFNIRETNDLITQWTSLGLVILGNFVGCVLTAFLASLSDFQVSSGQLVGSRLLEPLWAVILRAAGCGIVMSAAVAFARQKNWLPLLFGIPLFILCGFYHSIADTFYYSFAVFDGSVGLSWELVSWLGLTYFGNLLGCRLHLLFKV